MKKSLFLSMLGIGFLACSTSASGQGGIVFVGDSITQGGKFNDNKVSASYRYALFKHFVDSGVEYKPMGTTTGASGGFDVSSLTPNYRGVSFTNVSESAASGRSYQFSGHAQSNKLRPDPGTVSTAANRGPVTVKLGLENPYTGSNTTYYDGNALKTYTGDTYQSLYGDEKMSTVCIMIGVNDVYDTQGGSGTDYALPNQDTINYVKGIVEAYQQYNPDVNVVVMGLLPTGQNNSSYAYINAYNELLAPQVSGWSTSTSTVQYADVSEGFYAKDGSMIDTNRGAHPNQQGELIIAANLARVLGLEQRTAGLERKAAEQMSSQADLSTTTPVVTTTDALGNKTTVALTHLKPVSADATWSTKTTALGNSLVMHSPSGTDDDSLKMSWGGSGVVHEATFSMTLKMDAIDISGQTSSNFCSIFFGNGADQVGILRIGEDGIWWDQMLLYGSPNKDDGTSFMTMDFNDITVVYKMGEGAGYYVWFNDMLIGDQLTGSTVAGIVNAYKDTILFGKRTKTDNMFGEISNISMSVNGAYAPISQQIPEPASAMLGICSFVWLGCRRRRVVADKPR